MKLEIEERRSMQVLRVPCRLQKPVSVNYHFSRKCNKECLFCFHTATTSHIESQENAKRGLKLLKEAGMKKCNFAGGEPFLYPKFLGEMIDYCKVTLQLESVSIVSNGSLIKEQFLRKHGRNIDILAISCDSFDEATNIKIGRGSGNQVDKLYEIASWCQKYNIKFKLNTVVNRFNHLEDMNEHLSALQPFRWKCFQVLIVAGENDSDATLRNAHSLTITDEEFENFCQRHSSQASLVPEPNRLMAKSYLILDEYMRFLDRNGKSPSEPILKVGVQDALKSIFWDESAFLERGGLYDWNKGPCLTDSKKLEW
ncbi:radical SAM enzyme [Trichoderma citrinoviride]|uniref:Radical SAM enzyme n=1 Tax=Trichoderma citrinoviride TaxID=58853 RepID=A0A2T4AY62_9HYPO|nr:radical SAM enzyme [Trichoderma citrinoviride]PTB61997.1 radical SAM enzyme [Trichoderma citrinoviride]